MNNEIDNKENKKYSGMSLMEFQQRWYEAENDELRLEGKMDYNVVVDINGSEILADDYFIIGNDYDNYWVELTYKGHKTGSIMLKYIKLVY